mmetsp:Transcript_36054/g.75907  ORF Transcript_36054/g.75907 Transcript_36054/m.75907 type:complete len:89 (+) Transcript_36054:254-520(+)
MNTAYSLHPTRALLKSTCLLYNQTQEPEKEIDVTPNLFNPCNGYGGLLDNLGSNHYHRIAPVWFIPSTMLALEMLADLSHIDGPIKLQ